jgi:hypothetical protein
MNMSCIACEKENFILFEEFSALKRVTSDCKPFPEGGALTLCKGCQTIQKIPNQQWLEDINQIYQQYEVYSQSNGEEQAVFQQKSGTATKRSEVLAEFISNTNLLNITSGNVLDYGCANGEFLSIFSSKFNQWRLYGFDISNRYKDRLAHHHQLNFILPPNSPKQATAT